MIKLKIEKVLLQNTILDKNVINFYKLNWNFSFKREGGLEMVVPLLND
jgi:hypothetical protein